MPNLGSSHMVKTYSEIVIKQDIASAAQKLTSCRNIAGKIRNMGNDGRTNQKVDSAWLAMRSTSAVSRHSQIIPSMEISGSEAISPPIAGLRLAISDTAMIMMPDRTDLMMR